MALLATTALPAAAAGPTAVFGTESADIMANGSNYVGFNAAGLTGRMGMNGFEWWFSNAWLSKTASGVDLGTGLGAKYGLGKMGDFNSALYGNVGATYTGGAAALGAVDIGLALTGGLLMGSLSVDPNVTIGSLQNAQATSVVNVNISWMAPLNDKWKLVVQDAPHYAVTGGAISNDIAVGARFCPSDNAAIDFTVGQGKGYAVGAVPTLGSVTAWLGW